MSESTDEAIAYGRLLESVERTGAAVDALSERQHDDSGRLTRVESSVAALRDPMREQAAATRELTAAVDRLRVDTVRDVSALRSDVERADATAQRAHARVDGIERRVAAVETWQTASDGRRDGVGRLGSGLRGTLQSVAAFGGAAGALAVLLLWLLERV